MAGDDLGAERDLDPVDIALHHDLLVGATKRRETAEFEVASPDAAGRSPPGHRPDEIWHRAGMLASLERLNRRQIHRPGPARVRVPSSSSPSRPPASPDASKSRSRGQRDQHFAARGQAISLRVMHLRDRHLRSNRAGVARTSPGFLDLADIMSLPLTRGRPKGGRGTRLSAIADASNACVRRRQVPSAHGSSPPSLRRSLGHRAIDRLDGISTQSRAAPGEGRLTSAVQDRASGRLPRDPAPASC